MWLGYLTQDDINSRYLLLFFVFLICLKDFLCTYSNYIFNDVRTLFCFSLFSLFFNLFFYSTVQTLLPSHNIRVPHPIPLSHQSPKGCPQYSIPTPPDLPFLEPQISQGLGASSLTEARSHSPLLYICWGLRISWWIVSEIPQGSRLIETASPPTGSPSSSDSSSFLLIQSQCQQLLSFGWV